MLVRESPLGRKVKNDFDLYCDEALVIFYEWHNDPGNTSDAPLGSWRMAEDLSIPLRQAEDICCYLSGGNEKKEKFITKTSEQTRTSESGKPIQLGLYRINPTGIAKVERHLTAYNK